MGMKRVKQSELKYESFGGIIPGCPTGIAANVSTKEDFPAFGAGTENLMKADFEFEYDWDEVVLVVGGVIIWTPEGGERIVCEAGDYVIIPKGTKTRIEVPDFSTTFSVCMPPYDVCVDELLPKKYGK